MRRAWGRGIAAGVLAAFVPAMAWGWGCEAHDAVAHVALGAMSPRARAAAHALLDAHPIDPTLRRFCRSRSRDAFVTASTWADDLRDRRPDTGGWHFLNIPLDAGPDESPASFCPSRGCVTRTIRSEIERLRSSRSGEARADALRFLIHMVADLHQPLHAADNGDRGGNCVGVTYLRDRPAWSRNKITPNLHAVWDTRLVQTLLEREGLTPFQWAERLQKRFGDSIPAWRDAPADVHAWARESHRVAVETAYGALAKKIPPGPRVHPRDCREGGVGARLLALGVHVDERYVARALPVVEEQLAKAAARLAGMLDGVWP